MSDHHGLLATVLVLNWNGKRLLPDCLDALAKQDLPQSMWQTLVVDNASTDGSLDLLAADYPHVRVISNDQNLGFAGGNNVGLRAVQTPYVVLLNNDACPEPDWLRNLLDAARAPGAERVAAVTSKVLFQPQYLGLSFETQAHRPPADPRDLGVQVTKVEVDGDDVTEEVLWDGGAYGPEDVPGCNRYRWTRPSGSLLVPVPSGADASQVRLTARADRHKPFTVRWAEGESQVIEMDRDDVTFDLPVPQDVPLVDVVNNVGSILLAGGFGADRGYQEPDTGQYDQPEEVFLMCGAAVCLRTAALQEVGHFDADFFLYYEDTDLSWRLRSAGWDIRYTPDAVVRHEHSASSGEWSPLFTFHVERNRLWMLAKNAPAGMAIRQALRFNLTTLSMLRWALLQAVRDRRRPALRHLALRLQISGSYLWRLPRILLKRRTIARQRTRDPNDLLDRWMQTTR